MKFHHLGIFLFVFTLSAGMIQSQENLRLQLFGDVDRMKEQAKEKQADLYSPQNYKTAMEYYVDADEKFTKGKKLEDIREQITNASSYFSKAIDACTLAAVTFTAPMSARNDAVSADAPKFTRELWANAEKQFQRAARSLEDGDVNSAKSEGSEAETLYRTAELEAIKTNYLAPARELIDRAENMSVEDDAPKTLAKAKSLTVQVADLLNQNRYDSDEARQLAQQAKSEAAHAIYLSETIRKMKANDQTTEDIILIAEEQFQRVSTALGVRTGFENGYEPVANDILSAATARDRKIAADADSMGRLDAAVRDRDRDIENLRQQINSMQSRVGSLTDAEKKLQQKLSEQHEQEETVKRVAGTFTPEEGNVLRDGDNIIIRLYGLTFPVGKNTIEPQYYPLLTKVQDVIRKFSNCKVAIEGHTDSKGSDDVNQKLSESRAKAVAEYLMANMGVETPINYQGYGESRPVASNDSQEGRAKNRRIDVVIIPSWAVTPQ